MQINEFEQIGSSVFGGTRWGTQMASRLGLSTALISNIRTGKTEISPKVADRVQSLVAKAAVRNEDGEIVSFGETTVAGGAAFKLRLVAQDLANGRMAKVGDVNPALFFPSFAPTQTAPVAYYAAKGSAPVRSSDDDLSDDEILARIETNMSVMTSIAQSVIQNDLASMIVYGPAGIGKSFGIMNQIKAASASNSDFISDIIKGSISTPGLVRALFKARNGGVVVLDDADSVFDDEDTLNVLKAALDSSEERIISWRKESAWIKALAEEFDVDIKDVRNFEFKGGVIFITNLNLQAKIDAGHKMTKHYEALISRSYYIDLTMDSTRARMLRVKSIFLGSMAERAGLSTDEAIEVVSFMEQNKDRLREVSLRMATLVVNVYLSNRSNWKTIVTVTKMK
jgi:uncharacterized DUF497 family protein